MDGFIWDERGGVSLRRDFLAAGYDDRWIRRAVNSGVLVRIRRGAYVDRRHWDVLDAEARHRVLSRAVLLTAQPGSVLSHASAVIELGGKVMDMDYSQVHLTRLDGRAGRREAGVIQHRGRLPAAHVTLHDGVPVTVAARASVEHATLVSTESALVTTNWFLGSKSMSRDELIEMLRVARHWPGTLQGHVLELLADGRCRWPGEARFSYLAWRHGLPRPVPQLEIFDERGDLIGIVDFAWPFSGVFLEFDGRVKYEKFRRDGESLEQFLLREKKREEAICLGTGWVCLRVTWADLARPTVLASRVNAVLMSRSRNAG